MSKTITELLYLIEKKGLATKEELASMPLTADFLKRKASVEVYDYLLRTRAEECERALAAPSQKRIRQEQATEDARTKWNGFQAALKNGDASAEIIQATSRASDKIAENYPNS